MRPTKEALIRRACPEMDLYEYRIKDVLVDDAFKAQLADNSTKVIYNISTGSHVSEKLFLTNHQFTNVVGTDIYIYIGNTQGQRAYELILAELSKVRRLDERLTGYLLDECTDCMIELRLSDTKTDKILATLSEHPNKIIYAMPSEHLINRGLGLTLLDLGFKSIGDSHLFIYRGTTPGEQIITRLEQESFIHIA